MRELLSSVSSKGQVTIPIEIRQILGIKPKDKVAFIIENGDVKVKAAPSGLAHSYQAVPALRRRLSIEEMIAIAREEHAQEAVQEGS